jgi:TPP-dependent pyruvate/acetoin dehydrogenase alpha subunit
LLGAHLDQSVRDQAESEVKAELDEAVGFARSSAFPDPSEALDDVYA